MSPPGRRRFAASNVTILLGLLFLFTSTASAASAVLGIDFGTEYIKAAIVKPGIPLEIVLTKDSKRKEASAVAFKQTKAGLENGVFPERAYGGDALALSARFPGDVYPNLKHLLGKSFEGQAEVEAYRSLRPSLSIVPREGRDTVAFKSKSFKDDEGAFSVEELVAMILLNVKDNAKTMAGKGAGISEVVFTVPPFYTAGEKRALATAAKLAGLKVTGMVSDGLAVGINYATSRTFPDVGKDDNKPEYHLVFDMGAGSTSATVLRFQGKTVKDIGRFNKTIQEVSVLGAGWDKTLGGDSLNAIILDDMVTKFTESKGAKGISASAADVKGHGRAMSKLWAQAEKSRQILSANTETHASFESFYEDVDFKYKLTRTQFEEMTAEFATRLDSPIAQALAQAKLGWSDLNSVILHGGAVRTPFVQKRLESLADDKSKLRTSVNADESAVFGAAFKAAGLSPSFRVKEIRDQDTSGYASGVSYTWKSKERAQKLFTPTSQAGVLKEVPFKGLEDFEFTLYQEVPGVSDRAPVINGKTSNLTSAVTKLVADGCDRDSIDTKWSVRISPISYLPEVVKIQVGCEVEVGAEKDGGILGGIKGMFGGKKKEDQEVLEDDDQTPASEAAAEEPTVAPDQSEAKEVKDAKKKEEKKPEPPKKKKITDGVAVESVEQGYEVFPKSDYSGMTDRLASFDKSDKARRDRAELHNSLEAFTYKARDLITEEGFIAASTAEIRAELESKLSTISEWIYGEGAEATADVLKEKLKDLKSIVNPITKRRDEAKKRPELLQNFEDSLTLTERMVEKITEDLENAAKSAAEAAAKAAEAAASTVSEAVNPSESADPLADLDDSPAAADTPKVEEVDSPSQFLSPYTQADLDSVKDAWESAKAWFAEKTEAQSKLLDTEDSVFTSKDLETKAQDLTNARLGIMRRQMQEQARVKQEEERAKAKAKAKSKKPKSKKTKTKSAADEEETEKVDFENLKDPIQLNFGGEEGKDMSKEEIEEMIQRAIKEQKKTAKGKKDAEEVKEAHDEL